MNNEVRKNLDFYLALNYPITIHKDPGGGFGAEIEDLPGCMTQAETADELVASMEDAKRAWITATYESGQDIPLPKDIDDYKGRVLIRISRSLHRELVRSAKEQGISLNQYIANLLTAGAHGELLNKQVLELFDRSTSGMLGIRLLTGNFFGNNELPRRHSELVSLGQTEIHKG